MITMCDFDFVFFFANFFCSVSSWQRMSSTRLDFNSNFYDSECLRNIQVLLARPSSLIFTPKLTIEELLTRYQRNLDQPRQEITDYSRPSVFKPTHSCSEIKKIAWPESFSIDGPGVHFNRTELSEAVESSALLLLNHYVSNDTISSFSIAAYNSEKKVKERVRLIKPKSPGRRLSHLAKRRNVFSSINLAQSHRVGRQILVR